MSAGGRGCGTASAAARLQGPLAPAVAAGPRRQSCLLPLRLARCRALGLLGVAERLYRALEDGPGASHCRYLRAVLHDALGQAAERDADAAAFGALLLATPE